MKLLTRVLSVLGAFVLLWFLLYQVTATLFSSVDVVMAVTYSQYDMIQTTAVMIRNEEIIPNATTDGYLYYTLTDGSRVAVGGSIAQVYENENMADIRTKLDHLEKEIAMLEAIEAQKASIGLTIDATKKQTAQAVTELTEAVNRGTLDDIETASNDLQACFNRMQIATGAVQDFSLRLTALRSQRDALTTTTQKQMTTIKSPVSGYFVSETDGYETEWKPDDAVTWDMEEIRRAVAQTAPSNPPAENALGKIVRDYRWYIACVVPVERANDIATGKSFEIVLPFVANKPIPVKVVGVHKDQTEAGLLLECSEMSAELSGIRSEQMQILLKKYTGLRVPDTALHFNEENQPGVFVRSGNVMRFRRVEILYHNNDDRFSLCAPSEDKKFLREYDDIIMGGKELYDGKIIKN